MVNAFTGSATSSGSFGRAILFSVALACQPATSAQSTEQLPRDGATYFAERVWGVSLRYDLGDGHPLVGRSCPDFELEDGTWLGVLLRDGKGVLLDFHPRSPLRSLASRRDERLKYIASEAKDSLELTAVLVRPDGFVAWACDGEPDLGEVSRAAFRWFAQPRIVSSSLAEA